MALRYLDDGDYADGMIRDVPSWQLGRGQLYDAFNIIFDRPGVARQRGAWTSLFTGGLQNVYATMLGFCYSADVTPLEEVYGVDGKTGNFYNVNKTTGVPTLLPGGPAGASLVGRPVRHFGFVVFPMRNIATGVRNSYFASGASANLAFTNTAAASMTAGGQRVTLTGADTTTAAVRVGQFVLINRSPTFIYYGRVTSVDSATQFSVWPIPTVTDAAMPAGTVQTNTFVGSTGGACAASFQNRLLFGNCAEGLNSTSPPTISDRRFYYSPLLTEVMSTIGVTPVPVIGATFLRPQLGWPVLNFIEVPGSDPIVALEPVSDNQLLILTTGRPFVFSGNLITQLATTSPQVTFEISEVQGNASCITDLGVQRTSRGIVWAGYGGIYVWNGREPVDLTDRKINTYWRTLVRGANFAIHGSAYVRGHYLICGSSNAQQFCLCVNMTNLAWSRVGNIDIFLGIQRPTDPSQVWAVRWWDQTLVAGSFAAGGGMIRLESLCDPDTPYAGTLKADGSGGGIPVTLTTRTLAGDTETQKLHQRLTIRYQASLPSPGNPLSVTASPRIDAGEDPGSAIVGLGNLGNTEARAVTLVTNTTPIEVTTLYPHLLEDGDFVDITGVNGTTHANGRWRVNWSTLGNNNKFILLGANGNGAYISGGNVKKVTETDLQTTSLLESQGLSLTLAGTPHFFELHGLRTAYYENAPVMSA